MQNCVSVSQSCRLRNTALDPDPFGGYGSGSSVFTTTVQEIILTKEIGNIKNAVKIIIKVKVQNIEVKI